MSATDPLRDIAAELRDLGETYRDEYPDGRTAKRDLHEIAAKIEALAAVPAEPEHNDKRAAFLAGCGTMDALEVWAWAAELGEAAAEGAIETDEPLMVSVVRPGEPEAWEWQVADPDGRTTGPQPTADSAWSAADDGWMPMLPDRWLERRRPGTAPGEWERVDPEPRPQDGGER